MIHDPSTIKLGKKRGVVHDPRTLMASDVLHPTSVVKAPRHHRVSRLSVVPMFANDDFGDCTCASQGHRVVTQENSSGQRGEVQLTNGDVLAVYSAVTGFRADDPSTDNGAYELDVLNYMRTKGMGLERDGTPHTIGAFAAVDWRDHEEVRSAHYVFGGLKVCAALPVNAQDQEVWDVADGPGSEPGSWGGHSMYSYEYDEEGLVVWSWGKRKKMTWPWHDKYVDEEYASISKDYLRGRRTPQGFDLDRLEAYLHTLK